AGWVHGRPQNLPQAPGTLRDCALAAMGDAATLATLFDFETSLAKRDAQGNYRIKLSTLPARLGQSLNLDGFERVAEGSLRQQLILPDGRIVVRSYEVDTLEPEWQPVLTMPSTPEAEAWFDAEKETL